MNSYLQSFSRTLGLAFILAVGVSSANAQNFALRPGDAIKLVIPGEKVLSDTFSVDLQGTVTLPVIGRAEVAGQPWRDVHAKLLGAFQRELKEPGLSLTPLRRVVVLGAVNKPGNYLVGPTVTLSGAIAAASGAVTDGTARRVRVTRGNSVIQADAPRGMEIADMPVESGDQIFVLQRSWFARNSNFLITAILSLTGIVATFALR